MDASGVNLTERFLDRTRKPEYGADCKDRAQIERLAHAAIRGNGAITPEMVEFARKYPGENLSGQIALRLNEVTQEDFIVARDNLQSPFAAGLYFNPNCPGDISHALDTELHFYNQESSYEYCSGNRSVGVSFFDLRAQLGLKN